MKIEDVGERQIKTPARAIMVSRDDNVAVLLTEVHVGEEVILSTGWSEIALQAIPPGHKMAVVALEAGESIIKFGEVIGRATRQIQPGEHVHVHNLEAA